MTLTDLLPHHEKLIADSAITDEVALARGYRSATTKAELGRLGFGPRSNYRPACSSPSGTSSARSPFTSSGRTSRGSRTQARSSTRRRGGAHLTLDVPPSVLPILANPGRPARHHRRDPESRLGRPRVDLPCIDVLGVYGWRGRNDLGGLTALTDWEAVALNGRTIYLIFDSDVMVKRQVHDALRRFRQWLRAKKADVLVVYLPSGSSGAKLGLDDYLAAGHTADDVRRLAEEDLRPLPASSEDGEPPRHRTPSSTGRSACASRNRARRSGSPCATSPRDRRARGDRRRRRRTRRVGRVGLPRQRHAPARCPGAARPLRNA